MPCLSSPAAAATGIAEGESLNFGSPNPLGAEQDYRVLSGGAHLAGPGRRLWLLGVTALLNAIGITLSGSAENIAWMSGTTNPLDAANSLHSQWMGSDGHRRQILNPLVPR